MRNDKRETLNIRVKPEARELIDRAAKLVGKNRRISCSLWEWVLQWRLGSDSQAMDWSLNALNSVKSSSSNRRRYGGLA